MKVDMPLNKETKHLLLISIFFFKSTKLLLWGGGTIFRLLKIHHTYMDQFSHRILFMLVDVAWHEYREAGIYVKRAKTGSPQASGRGIPFGSNSLQRD